MSDIPEDRRPLRLGFLLFEYFPFGGLQRDCLRTALACAGRGHRVTIFTRSWEGDYPAGVAVECLGRRGWTNVSRNRIWWRRAAVILAQRSLDGVVGFNKLPGLDVYFGADPCYVAKMDRLRPAWHRRFPRYRFYRTMESAVFQRGQSAHILLLTEHEIPTYRGIYDTEPERFHILPPGITKRSLTGEQWSSARARLRREHGWSESDLLLLLVGSGFRVKGLDRAIAALGNLAEPLRARARLVVIGKNRPGPFARLAVRAGVAARVHFLGPRADVPDWLLAADLLIHPAYSESAGIILLEALASGLPVLTTDTCGYAWHIEKAGAGQVLSSPFSQEACGRVLQAMLEDTAWRESCRMNGLNYADREDLYSCHEKAADIIEACVRRKKDRPGADGVDH